jgi:Tfp pilus assembly protein PilF
MQEARQTPTPRRSTRPPAPKSGPSAAQPQPRSLQDFQTAVQFLQESKFEKARALFDKLSHDSSAEITERARTYLAVCDRNAKKSSLSFVSTEEQYDYAISLLNTGSYEDARDQFESILSAAPHADFAHYGIALLSSMTGQAEEALDHLSRAIQLNPSNRIQARSDPDFIDMADDPRFTELLYPEIG